MRINERARASLIASLAAKIRIANALQFADSVNPIDACIASRASVWMKNIPGLEGLYLNTGNPVIVLAAQRPLGRQNFTAAHELGHALLGHGNSVEQFIDQKSQSNNEESEADFFATHLLLHPSAVSRAYRAIEVDPAIATSLDHLIVAWELGVSYRALVSTLTYRDRKLTENSRTELLRHRVRDIASAIANVSNFSEAILVGELGTKAVWDSRTGDVLCLPKYSKWISIDSGVLPTDSNCPSYDNYIVNTPGVRRVRVGKSERPILIRTSKRLYEGLAKFRHMKESE